MKVVAITGGIASGKSTISEYLKDKYEAYVFDADNEAKKLIQLGSVSKKIKEAFPNLLDLSKLSIAKEVFKNKESQKKINDIVHPIVNDLIFQRMKDKKNSCNLFVVDAALIIESGNFQKLRENKALLILVVAKKNLRLKRALNRGDLSLDTINDRIQLQMTDNEKISHADFIIENSSSKSELFINVDKVMEKIIYE